MNNPLKVRLPLNFSATCVKFFRPEEALSCKSLHQKKNGSKKVKSGNLHRKKYLYFVRSELNLFRMSFRRFSAFLTFHYVDLRNECRRHLLTHSPPLRKHSPIKILSMFSNVCKTETKFPKICSLPKQTKNWIFI